MDRLVWQGAKTICDNPQMFAEFQLKTPTWEYAFYDIFLAVHKKNAVKSAHVKNIPTMQLKTRIPRITEWNIIFMYSVSHLIQFRHLGTIEICSY